MAAPTLPGQAERAGLTPHQARTLYRNGLVTSTAGWCDGYAQANLMILPQENAFDFLLFATRNPKPCPILGVLDAGETTGPLLAGDDIRTAVPAYTIYRDGQLVDTVTSLDEYWRDDLVTFIIGCSFTFEAPLMDAGISIAHIDQGGNVPMYSTNVSCQSAGRLAGPTVVSMRPISPSRVADAVRITSRYPSVHGAPIHIGDPEGLGITDLGRPDFGDPVVIPEGTIPVFWACGVTPQAAVMQSKPPIAFGHAPGHMLITDKKNSAYLIP